jgi:hypothetical protein
MAIGRVLRLPYSNDPKIRKQEEKEVIKIVHETAREFENEWKQAWKDPSNAEQYKIDRFHLLHERV